MPANVRLYGEPPFTVALVHGGPGAAGEMAPVARRLSSAAGVMEPLQTRDSLEGQVSELHDTISAFGRVPLILAGFSWGAWLSYILAARYPHLVDRLILISSAPFQQRYAGDILKTRLSRLDERESLRARALIAALEGPSAGNEDIYLKELSELFYKADSFDPLPRNPDAAGADFHIHSSVWREASGLRKSGQLLTMGRNIRCPIKAVHGDHDPHPARGVSQPLEGIAADFTFALLDKCGHYPWLERQAGEEFFRLLAGWCSSKS